MTSCSKHPDSVLFINGICSWCLSEQKAQERKLFKTIPDRLLADVVVTPTAQAEEILKNYGARR